MKLDALALIVLATSIALARPTDAQTYTYDAAGRLTQVTYPGLTTIAYTYDAAGNVTQNNVTPTPPGGGGGGVSCFIATAAYGSPLHPHVQALRDFRDEHLLTNAPGRAFCAWYAEVSPPLAAFLNRHPTLKPPARLALAPLVYSVAYPRAAPCVVLLLLAAAWRWRRRRRARLHAATIA